MAITPTPPNVVDMEKEVLSAMLLKEGLVIPAVSAILKADDFYLEEHGIIYLLILKVFNDTGTVNILLLIEALKKDGKFDRVGPEKITEIVRATYTTAYAELYAKKIKEKSVLRSLIRAGDYISNMAAQDTKPLEEVLDDAEKKIFAVTSQNEHTEFEELQEILKRAYEKIKKISENPESIYGVPGGFSDLDKITNGFQKSDLILLAARPSMGKTAFALNIAVNAALAKKNVAIFSLEMSKEQIGHRLLSSHSQIDSRKLTSGKVNEEELKILSESVRKLSEANIFIDDTAGISIMELRSKARRLKASKGLDIILIDYLQLMQGGSSRNVNESNRQQEISEISRSLKALARELNVPIIALSQLSRSVELRAEKRPQLSDLRESGSLEQDADIVMFLYREEYYNKESDKKTSAELIIAKNRNGPTTSVQLFFHKEIMRFNSLEHHEE